jgi:O-antigen/teichoic acid export membrane protein
VEWGEAMSANCLAPMAGLEASLKEPNWYAIWSSFIFGQKWQGLSTLLLVQAPGYILAAVFWGVLNPALLVSGKHRQILVWLAGFFILYSVLTRWLSPSLGAMGVAIAFSSTEIIFHPWLFSMYGLKRLEYRKFLPEIFVGAVFTGMLWFCAQHSLRAGFLCGTLYLIVWCVRHGKTLVAARKGFDFTAGAVPLKT